MHSDVFVALYHAKKNHRLYMNDQGTINSVPPMSP